MTRTTEQQLDWNSFQRKHKGKWSRVELNRQWNVYKEQLLSRNATVQTTADSNTSRALQVAALKEGIKVLTTSKRPSDTIAGHRKKHQSNVQQPQPCSAIGAAAEALSITTCAAAAVDDASGSCQQHTATKGIINDDSHIHCIDSSMQSDSADSQQAQQQLQVGCTLGPSAIASSLANPTGVTAAAAERADDASPDSSPDPVSIPSDPSHELQKLREAVYHLLAKHNSNPALQHPQHWHNHQQPDQQLNHDIHQQQLDLQHSGQHTHMQSDSIGSCFPAPALQPAEPPAALPSAAPVEDTTMGSGCFGLTLSRTKLSWNAFQKACKGRAMIETQISEAYQHAKQHHALTGQMLDLDAYLQQQQQTHHHQQQQQVLSQQHVPQVGSRGLVRGLQQWLHSAAASRAASRACSTAVSPTSSPARGSAAAACEAQQQQQQHGFHNSVAGVPEAQQLLLCSRTQACQGPQYVGGGRGRVGAWTALKEWVSSRSSSRAGSRLGTPAASPGLKCEPGMGYDPGRCTEWASNQQQQAPQLQQGPEQQQAGHEEQHGLRQQHQVVCSSEQQGECDDAKDAAYMPFATQRQPYGGHWQPQTQQQQQQQQQSQGAAVQAATYPAVVYASTAAAAAAGCAGVSAQASLLAPCVSNSSSCTASLGSNSSSKQPSGVYGTKSHTPQSASADAGIAVISRPSATTLIVAAAAAPAAAVVTPAVAAGSGVRIGPRLARECVPDNLAGMLEGFGQWVAAEPHQLKRLKSAVPAQPGLYEWGVQLPCSKGSYVSAGASATLATAAGADEGHSPVLAFYLGKAGTLQPQRPRRSGTQYGTASTGETLRTRLNKYCFSKAQKLGPVNEPHKAAFFQQQLDTGGKLFVRWWVCTNIEPVVAETMLLTRLDYALNYLHNNDRRRLLV